MQLSDVPRNTWIRVLDDDIRTPPCHEELNNEDVYYFHHLDGMYSLCEKTNGDFIHLMFNTEVEIIRR